MASSPSRDKGSHQMSRNDMAPGAHGGRVADLRVMVTHASRVLMLLFAVATYVCVYMLLCPSAAHADVSAMKLDPQPLAVTQVRVDALGSTSTAVVENGAAQLPLSRLCPMTVTATCDPDSIEAGISCGMDWMCGLRPCLCGSADEWGGCSCNGMETVRPETAFTSSDESVVRVVQFAGKTWFVPVGVGTATVTCDATLRYHDDARAAVEVTVGGLTAPDGVLIAACIGAVAIIVALVFVVRRVAKRKREEAAE